MKDYRGQRQRFQNKFNDINNGNEPEIDMFSEAQAFMSWIMTHEHFSFKEKFLIDTVM